MDTDSLETFLGGMETIDKGKIPPRQHAPLKPSLVEWKPPRYGGDTVTPPRLETFLGGMETDQRKSCWTLRAFLETFLGGMETPQITTNNYMQLCLETFLGGMETGVQVGVYYRHETLKPSLVEWKPAAPLLRGRSAGCP